MSPSCFLVSAIVLLSTAAVRADEDERLVREAIGAFRESQIRPDYEKWRSLLATRTRERVEQKALNLLEEVRGGSKVARRMLREACAGTDGKGLTGLSAGRCLSRILRANAEHARALPEFPLLDAVIEFDRERIRCSVSLGEFVPDVGTIRLEKEPGGWKIAYPWLFACKLDLDEAPEDVCEKLRNALKKPDPEAVWAIYGRQFRRQLEDEVLDRFLPERPGAHLLAAREFLRSSGAVKKAIVDCLKEHAGEISKVLTPQSGTLRIEAVGVFSLLVRDPSGAPLFHLKLEHGRWKISSDEMGLLRSEK